MRLTAGCSLILLLAALALAATGCGTGEGVDAAAERAGVEEPVPVAEKEEEIEVTVIFDNNPYLEGLKTAWGFSCLVEGGEKTVLFDTGGDGDILLYNMERLGIDPGRIDAVVISHTHGDHTGGLPRLMSINPDLEVYLPASAGAGLKDSVRSSASLLVEVSDALPVCAGIWSTGELGSGIREQALVVESDAGLLVITGCAHPGIVDMVRAAKATVAGEVVLAMGGFHLRDCGSAEIERIIAGLKELGVRRVGPCHCTGDNAMRSFADAFGEDYIMVGVGKRIAAGEL